MIEKAFAKINLFLHVEGKLSNGYHSLKSLVCFAKDIFDEITINESHKFELEVKGAEISAQENLVYQAYNILRENFSIPSKLQNIKITLEKKIPIGAGLGGGSADAAATLKILSKLWKLDNKKILPLSIKLGADVPVCFQGFTSFVEGIGGKVKGPILLPHFYILIINPNKMLLTKQVFEKNEIYNVLNLNIKDRYNEVEFMELLEKTSNDLEKASISILSDINLIKRIILTQEGSIACRMSGSGASVIGIFFNKLLAEKAAQLIKREYKNWWIEVSENI